jgi:hypothetical protein
MAAGLLLVLPTEAVAQDAPADLEPSRDFPTPPYLPRSAFVGTFVNTAWTPQLRIQWELTALQRRADALVIVLEGGGGYGVALPQNLGPGGMVAMTRLYQLTALAGIGYRADPSSRWHWGVQAATGPLFYGTRFNDSTSEDSVLGMLEVRAQLGLRYGAYVYGISVGYAELYPGFTSTRSTPFLGGFLFGVFADRR